MGADKVGLPPSHRTAGPLQEGSSQAPPGDPGVEQGNVQNKHLAGWKGRGCGPWAYEITPLSSTEVLPNVRVGILALNGSRLKGLTGWSLQGFQIPHWHPESVRGPEGDLEEYQAACLGWGYTRIRGHRRLDADFCSVTQLHTQHPVLLKSWFPVWQEHVGHCSLGLVLWADLGEVEVPTSLKWFCSQPCLEASRGGAWAAETRQLKTSTAHCPSGRTCPQPPECGL